MAHKRALQTASATCLLDDGVEIRLEQCQRFLETAHKEARSGCAFDGFKPTARTRLPMFFRVSALAKWTARAVCAFLA